MPYFVLTYEVVDDFVNKRTPFRPAHLQEVREAHQRGELVMAGALGEPSEALLVFRVGDRSVVEKFVTNDPYVSESALLRTAPASASGGQLVDEVASRFGVLFHRRTVERARRR